MYRLPRSIFATSLAKLPSGSPRNRSRNSREAHHGKTLRTCPNRALLAMTLAGPRTEHHSLVQLCLLKASFAQWPLHISVLVETAVGQLPPASCAHEATSELLPGAHYRSDFSAEKDVSGGPRLPQNYCLEAIIARISVQKGMCG